MDHTSDIVFLTLIAWAMLVACAYWLGELHGRKKTQ
jgi:hypothetical protein